MDFSESRKIIEEWRSKTKPLQDESETLYKKIKTLDDTEQEINKEYSALLGNKKPFNYDIPQEVIDSAINTSQLKEISFAIRCMGYEPKRSSTNLFSFNRKFPMRNAKLIPIRGSSEYQLLTNPYPFTANITIDMFKNLEDSFNYLDTEGKVNSDIPYNFYLWVYDSCHPKLFLNKVDKWTGEEGIDRVLKKEEANAEGVQKHIRDIEAICDEISDGKRPLYYYTGRGTLNG